MKRETFDKGFERFTELAIAYSPEKTDWPEAIGYALYAQTNNFDAMCRIMAEWCEQWNMHPYAELFRDSKRIRAAALDKGA